MPSEQICGERWRWIGGVNDWPLSNMAIDQAVFEAHSAGMAPPTVRVYTWGRHTVTIGRLQSAERAMAQFPGLPCLRRPTGGRAVLHGDDLTIAVAVREELLQAGREGRGLLASYFVLLTPVIDTLKACGVEIARGQDRRRAKMESEDCFAHAATCDLVDHATGKKLLGSAQLRSKGTILQQMSLRPLQTVDIAGAEFERDLRRRFEEVLHVPGWIRENELTTNEITRAKEIDAGAPAFL